MGLNPITLGSRPGPKADAQPLCHPGAPALIFIISSAVVGLICCSFSSFFRFKFSMCFEIVYSVVLGWNVLVCEVPSGPMCHSKLLFLC